MHNCVVRRLIFRGRVEKLPDMGGAWDDLSLVRGAECIQVVSHRVKRPSWPIVARELHRDVVARFILAADSGYLLSASSDALPAQEVGSHGRMLERMHTLSTINRYLCEKDYLRNDRDFTSPIAYLTLWLPIALRYKIVNETGLVRGSIKYRMY